MPYDVGDRVHITLFGTGVVREVRNAGRYLVDVKGAAMVVTEGQLTAAEERTRRRARASAPEPPAETIERRGSAGSSLDLHGCTRSEAESAVDAFVNDAALAGLAEVRIVHGRSGGRVRAVVHARLTQLSVVRSFRLDPANPGVTIVSL